MFDMYRFLKFRSEWRIISVERVGMNRIFHQWTHESRNSLQLVSQEIHKLCHACATRRGLEFAKVDEQVWYSSARLNVHIYRVGRKVCP